MNGAFQFGQFLSVRGIGNGAAHHNLGGIDIARLDFLYDFRQA